MMGGNHSKRSQAPQWAVRTFFSVIALALLWVAWVFLFA